MSPEYIQGSLLEERDLPPSQEFDHFYGWSTYEELDQPMKDEVPDGYYITSELTKYNIYPSQFKYADDNFAIVMVGGELTVFAKKDYPKWYGPFINSGANSHKSSSVDRVWVEQRDVVFNPNSLKGLQIIGGRMLENASREEIGGKAFGEAKLMHYEHFGYKVPDFFVIPTSYAKILQTHGFSGRAEEIMESYASAADVSRRDCGIVSNVAGHVPNKIKDLFESLNIYDSIFVPQIIPALLRLEFNNHNDNGRALRVKVRSSYPLEDGNENLFQGVFNSRSAYLTANDEFHNVYGAFEEVMLSPWSVYAESYFRNRHLVGKVPRYMAEMVQIIPSDLKFIGRGYFQEDVSEIEYLDHLVESGDYVGNRVYINNNKGIVEKRIDNVQDYGMRNIGNFGELIPNDTAITISQIMEKLSVVFPEYSNKFNIEFGIAEDGTIYLFQIRPTKRKPISGVIPDLNCVDRNKIMFECSQFLSPFSVGKVVGPVVNLLSYNLGYGNNLSEEYRKEYLEKIEKFDKEQPGSIFIVNLNTLVIKDIDILTPNKKGIIVCYEHDTISRNDHIVEELYRDPTFHIVNVIPKLFKNIPTGARIGIVSSGERAIFYKPEETEPDSIIFDPPTVYMRDVPYGSLNTRYVQHALPLKKRNKRIY